MFERSASGQSNRALFYGVDFVCYTEGGADDGDFGPDITFWRTIFECFMAGKTFKFLSKGGKPILERLAHEIVNEDIHNTIVAFDSDYDAFRGRKILDRRVFYTYGYSWENDIIQNVNLEIVYNILCHCDDTPDDVRAAIGEGLSKLSVGLRRAVHADFFALCSGGSIIPRDRPGRIVRAQHDGFPCVVFEQVRALVRSFNAGRRGKKVGAHNGPPNDILRYCVGKIMIHAARLMMTYIISEFFRKKNIHNDHFRDVCIMSLPKCFVLHPNSPFADFHQNQCETLLG